MKGLNMLIWLTQLGMSVAMPLGGFLALSLWLRSRFALGIWVVLCGCAVGLICAIDGLRYSLKAMEMLNKRQDGDKNNMPPPSVSFNDHD